MSSEIKVIKGFLFVAALVITVNLFKHFITNDENKPSNKEIQGEKIQDLSVNGNTASFTFDVGFFYTMSYCALGSNVWAILKEYPQVNTINVKIIEEYEDHYGEKHTMITDITLNSEWMETTEVRKYKDSDSFCNHAQDTGSFMALWVPKGNNHD